MLRLPEKKPDMPNLFHTGYSLFGAEDITSYGANLHVAGDVYSGGNFTFGGTEIMVNGACSAVGAIHAYTGNAVFTESLPFAEEQPMPVLRENLMQELLTANSVDYLEAYNSTMITRPTYCMRTTGAYCPKLLINETLVCEGNLHVSTDTAIIGEEREVAICSLNGDITIQGSHLYGKGMIYAPHGTVTINVFDMKYRGSIIARRIILQGTDMILEQP
ncbi:MAG: hypothetical protein IJF07_09440 [Lachnospiraceae bacterium]|nr:hypothetical protein [Lachnospiraceae bacterium]